MLAAWFGSFEFDDPHAELPWSKQMIADFTILDKVEGWDGFSQHIIDDRLSVFNNPDVKHAFVKYDHKHLRATLLDELDNVFTPRSRHELTSSVPSKCFECLIPEENGVRCGHVAKKQDWSPSP